MQTPMGKIRLGVVGSRLFRDTAILNHWLDRYAADHEIVLVVSGGAEGADTMADVWAQEHDIPTMIIKPDWGYYGKAAAFVRNRAIVANSNMLLAFYPSRERTRGTAHTVMLARQAGIPVEEVFVDETLREAFYEKPVSAVDAPSGPELGLG